MNDGVEIITQNEFYTRNLNDTIYQKTESSYISLCYYAGLIDCLENINNNFHNMYLLCVGYKEKDFQIALTGSCKKEESIENAANRETFEEVDVQSNSYELFTQRQFKQHSKIINSYVFRVKACNCIQSIQTRNDSQKIFKCDDTTKKITVVIYGTFEEITKIMCNSRLHVNNTEKIGFYSAIKISEAISICQQICILRKKHHWRTIFPYNFCEQKSS